MWYLADYNCYWQRRGTVFHGAPICGRRDEASSHHSRKDLIAATEIDYREYRGEIKRLRDKHPLFEIRPDISMADFENHVAETLLLSAIF